MSIFGHLPTLTSAPPPISKKSAYYLTGYGSKKRFPKTDNLDWGLGIGGAKSMHILHKDCKIVSASFNCVDDAGISVRSLGSPIMNIYVNEELSKSIFMPLGQKSILMHFEDPVVVKASQGIQVKLGTNNKAIHEVCVMLRIEEE